MGWLLTNPEKKYIDSAKTDVMRTWRKHGFIPPSESKFKFLTESEDRDKRNETTKPSRKTRSE
jgi:hypothetical protein